MPSLLSLWRLYRQGKVRIGGENGEMETCKREEKKRRNKDKLEGRREENGMMEIGEVEWRSGQCRRVRVFGVQK